MGLRIHWLQIGIKDHVEWFACFKLNCGVACTTVYMYYNTLKCILKMGGFMDLNYNSLKMLKIKTMRNCENFFKNGIVKEMRTNIGICYWSDIGRKTSLSPLKPTIVHITHNSNRENMVFFFILQYQYWHNYSAGMKLFHFIYRVW